MKLKIITLALTIFFLTTTAYSINTNESKNIYDIIVPDDYSTIQEALDNSQPGNTIFIKQGIYRENILINKENITIKGSNKYRTIIDGQRIKSTIKVISNNVKIKNLTVTNGEKKGKWDSAGIDITSSNVEIKDNIIKDNLLGINALDTSRNLTIINNKFYNDSILLCNSERTYYKFIKDKFYHTIKNNSVNDKPIYYYKNSDKIIVPSDAGMVYVTNCTNITIKDSSFSKCDFPVIVEFCNYCLIENITVDDSYGEVITLNSENCTIQNNKISGILMGICLDYESRNNIVRYNTLSNNYAGIVIMTKSNNNKIYENKIIQNKEIAGIFLYNNSHDNEIYNNFLIKNIYGFKLAKTPYENNIHNNTIKKSIYTVISEGKTTNNWNNNYYNIPKLFRKNIYNFKLIFNFLYIPIGLSDVDKNPAKYPPV